MREILFKGKRKDNGEWVEGFYCPSCFWVFPCIPAIVPKEDMDNGYWHPEEVNPETVGQFTGLTDKNGTKIFEGDIVQYQNLMEFDIQSVVKFGEYLQDGSSGEYKGAKCIGFYVEVDNFTCPDWCDNQPEYFNEYWFTENLLQVNENCEVIGNIHDNPKLLGGE